MDINTKKLDETIAKLTLCLKKSLDILVKINKNAANFPSYTNQLTLYTSYNDYHSHFASSAMKIHQNLPIETFEESEEIIKNNQELPSFYSIENQIDENLINVSEKQEKIYLEKLRKTREMLFNLYIENDRKLYDELNYSNEIQILIPQSDELTFYKHFMIAYVCIGFAQELSYMIHRKIRDYSEPTTQTPTKEEKNETYSRPKEKMDKPIKLQWNASKSALYHLFARLSELSTVKGKTPLNYTPEQLAAFLSESFTNLPEKKTIEREIQKYRTNGGSAEKDPPKDTIDLEGIDFDH